MDDFVLDILIEENVIKLSLYNMRRTHECPDVIYHVVCVLMHLSEDIEISRNIGKFGGLKRASETLTLTRDPKLRIALITLMTNLANDEENRNSFAKSCGIYELLYQLYDNYENCKVKALEALGSIALNAQCRKVIMREGGIAKILELALPLNAPEMRDNALRALNHLSVDPECAKSLIRKNAIAKLLPHVKHKLESAVELMSNLSDQKESHELSIISELIPVLLTLVNDSQNKIRIASLTCLSNIVQSHSEDQSLTEKSVLKSFTVLLRSSCNESVFLSAKYYIMLLLFISTI